MQPLKWSSQPVKMIQLVGVIQPVTMIQLMKVIELVIMLHLVQKIQPIKMLKLVNIIIHPVKIITPIKINPTA